MLNIQRSFKLATVVNVDCQQAHFFKHSVVKPQIISVGYHYDALRPSFQCVDTRINSETQQEADRQRHIRKQHSSRRKTLNCPTDCHKSVHTVNRVRPMHHLRGAR